MRYNVVEEKELNSKEVKKVLKDFVEGKISKSSCIEELFFVCGLDSNVIKNMEELGISENSMCYNVIKKCGLLRGIDIRNSSDIDKGNNGSNGNGLSNEFIEFVDKWISEKKSMKLNDVVIGCCLNFRKSEVYIRKLVKRYEKLKNIEFVKSR